MTEQELRNVYNDTAPIREWTEIECEFSTFKSLYESYKKSPFNIWETREYEVHIVDYIHTMLYRIKEHCLSN